MENVAVVAPMPRAATTIAVTVKPGDRRSDRIEYLRSCTRMSRCTRTALPHTATTAPISTFVLAPPGPGPRHLPFYSAAAFGAKQSSKDMQQRAIDLHLALLRDQAARARQPH